MIEDIKKIIQKYDEYIEELVEVQSDSDDDELQWTDVDFIEEKISGIHVVLEDLRNLIKE